MSERSAGHLGRGAAKRLRAGGRAGSVDGNDRSGSMAGLSRVVSRAVPRAELDDVDRRILGVLRADARMSLRQVARAVGMSGPAVGERIARLEKQGVIKGYAVDLDFGALGLPVSVIIPMVIAPGTDLTELMTELRGIPEVDELSVVTGAYDLIARLRLRDHSHLQSVLLERLWPVRGLQRVETFLILGDVGVPGMLEQVLTPPPLLAEADPEEVEES